MALCILQTMLRLFSVSVGKDYKELLYYRKYIDKFVEKTLV